MCINCDLEICRDDNSNKIKDDYKRELAELKREMLELSKQIFEQNKKIDDLLNLLKNNEFNNIIFDIE